MNRIKHLYTIRNKKTHQESYLFLTKHVINSNIFKIDKEVYNILEKCDGIIFESSPYNDTSILNQKTIEYLKVKIKADINKLKFIKSELEKNKHYQNEKNTLKTLLEKHKKIECLYKKMIKIRKNMKGNQSCLMISLSHLAFGLLYPESCMFMESELLNFAENKKKIIKYLDRSIIIEKKYQKKILEKNVNLVLGILQSLANKKNFDFHQKIESNLVNEYLNERLNPKKRMSKEIYIQNIIVRNKKWISKIISNPNFLFAIGADHFKGRFGLENLLKKMVMKFMKQ